MYGDPNRDTKYILAKNYRALYSHVPQEVKDLIDKDSEERSLANITAYDNSSTSSYTYGLFNYNDPFFSNGALSRIEAERIKDSEMLRIKYMLTDPGLAYYTMLFIVDEFKSRYRNLKFGEVDNLVQMYEKELAKAKDSLSAAEDSLMHYNIKHRIINYPEETKQLAILNSDYETEVTHVRVNMVTSKVEVDMLGSKIERFSSQLKKNLSFLNHLSVIGELSEHRTKILMDTVSEGKKDRLQEIDMKIRSAENEIHSNYDENLGILLGKSRDITEQKYSKEGVPSSDYVKQWIDANITYEKSKSELNVLNSLKNNIDSNYLAFSPVGTTLSRRERKVSMAERNYLEIFNDLNDAKGRMKNIQLSSASLKMVTPPIFPIASLPMHRMRIIILVLLGSVIFIIGVFLIMFFLDRSLTDKMKTEYIIRDAKVIGAYPKDSLLKYRMYNTQYKDMSIHALSNAVMNFFDSVRKKHYINITSIEKHERKEEIAQALANYIMNAGFSVKILLAGEDFISDSRDYIAAGSVSEFYEGEEDVVIIIHPSCKESSIPSSMLRNSDLNMLLLNASMVWSEANQIMYENLLRNSAGAPLRLCLVDTDRYVLETFAGMLPPYTAYRKFIYKIMQSGYSA
jgi:hypothetical protein